MSKNKIISIVVLAIFIIGSLFIISNNSKTALAPVIKTPTAQIPNNSTTTLVVKQYTLSEVALHASESNCWTAINGKVYDVTPFTSKHPGGVEAILSLCGKDGSSAFNNQHGGQERQANELAKFIIGDLKQ